MPSLDFKCNLIMVTFLLGALVLLLIGTLAIDCPTFTCTSLSSGVCAQLNSTSEILINTAQCPSTSPCSLTTLLQWYWAPVMPAVNQTYNCADPTYQTMLPTSWSTSAWRCSERGSNITLMTGTYPKDCQTDDDCMLEGSLVVNGSCGCSMRGSSTLGTCKPSLSSPLFEKYWTACGTSGFIVGGEGLYWFLYSTYYALYQTDVACSSNLWEFQALQVSLSGSRQIALGAFFFGMVWFSLA